VSEVLVIEAVPCPLGPEECSGVAEPEEADGCVVWTCDTCGFSLITGMAAPQEDVCSVGVPPEQQTRRPVFVELGRRT